MKIVFSSLPLCGFFLNLIFATEVFSAQNGSTTGQPVLLESLNAPNNGHCIWYGLCHFNYYNNSQRKYNQVRPYYIQGGDNSYNSFQNCDYRGPAQPLEGLGNMLLRKWCPFMNEPAYCCNVDQMEMMFRNVGLAENFLKRCPSCMQNFMKLLCFMMCSPHQSNFLETKQTKVHWSSTKVYVTEINYYITQEYMDKVYNSCKQITVPSTGQLAMDLMCGSWGASKCSSNRWFEFMGSAGPTNPLGSFQINYISSTSKKVGNYTPLNLEVTPCNKGIDERTPACSCADCEASCPIPQSQPPIPQPFRIAGFGGLAFIMIVVFVVGTVTFLATVLYYRPLANDVGITSDSSEIGIEMDIDVLEELRDSSPSFVERLDAKPNTYLEKHFERWGTLCAQKPWLVLFLGACLVMGFGTGIIFLKIRTDTLELWAAPTSRSLAEKEYFDSHFGPIYRKEQVIIRAKNLRKVIHPTSLGNVTFGPAFNDTFLKEVLHLQEKIKALGEGTWYSYDKICFAPLRNPDGETELDKCLVQSIWGYYQDNENTFDITSHDPAGFKINYLDAFLMCAENPNNPDCLAPHGASVDPALVLGGFLEPDEKLSKSSKYEKASAVILTFLVNNYDNKSKLVSAMEWEKVFVEYMRNFARDNVFEFMDIAFTSELSMEDDLDRDFQGNVIITSISYVIWIAYIAVFLGQVNNFSKLFTDSKFGVGIDGGTIVCASVVASIGLLGYVGIPATTLIIEVIFFLVLAVGVNNIFILVQSHQRNAKKPTETIAQHIGRTLGQVGPSILLTSISECCCFFLAGFSDMPALRTFAIYASMALLMNFLLQMTCLISLLVLHTRRQNSDRFYFFCCDREPNENEPDALTVQEGLVYTFFKSVYVPLLMNKHVRCLVMVVFFGWLCSSVSVVPHIEIGLDQKLTIRDEDSFVLKYFKYQKDYLSIGPPMYFVVKSGLNYSNYEDQNRLCGGQFCNVDSLVKQVYMASKTPESTYIAKPCRSWLDDYFEWSTMYPCCRYNNIDGGFCPHGEDKDVCTVCLIDLNATINRPTPAEFQKYISFFLRDNPDIECEKAGHVAHGNAVDYKTNPQKHLSQVEASYFMTYHTNLKTSSDYYDSIKAARKISDNLTKTVGVEVFPYSGFYLFYDQYLTIWQDSLLRVGISLLAVCLITFLLMGLDIFSSFLVLITITMILVNLGGLMYWWHITLNAVSLVNLLMAVGISVEFCSHLVHSFSVSTKTTRIERASDALVSMGSSIFSGITLTQLLGIIAIYFAKSQILQVFHFRMYLGIVLIGMAHGLIFLPVLLSL